MGFDVVVDKLVDGMQRCISRHRLSMCFLCDFDIEVVYHFLSCRCSQPSPCIVDVPRPTTVVLIPSQTRTMT